MHTYILNTSKRCSFWVCNCPPNQHLTMLSLLTLHMKQVQLGCFLLPPGMGSIKCLSTRQRGQSTGSGTGTIPCGCCCALLNMCFTSCILTCQCIILLSEYFLWRICALSITMFKQCTKNFFDHLTLLCRKTVVLSKLICQINTRHVPVVQKDWLRFSYLLPFVISFFADYISCLVQAT